ncbi:hypothetical protein [Emticicia sp. BO119]|uniref:hypothetical protein n=1 Tax=Emticicia sp. BO119 TaxID=2757768 RepID=UPI0015EFF6B7|nr:hypothetical protein [Emticicia sp. BO119]MBA4849707.1 hypothetical protein [Emticicia sp. BO119]
MIKKLQHLIDFLYYFFFQASIKKSPEVNYHYKVANRVAAVFVYLFICLGFILSPLLKELFLEIDIRWLLIITLIFIVIFTFCFSYRIETLYSKKGKRFFIIKEFDKKYDFKDLPPIYDIVAISGVILSSMLATFFLTALINYIIERL